MSYQKKIMLKVLSGGHDRSMKFHEIQKLLYMLGFQCRIRGDHFIYWSEADQCFIVEVPELPGCMADGMTPAEALENVEVVISEWIETALALGREIPVPKGKLMFA